MLPFIFHFGEEKQDMSYLEASAIFRKVLHHVQYSITLQRFKWYNIDEILTVWQVCMAQENKDSLDF